MSSLSGKYLWALLFFMVIYSMYTFMTYPSVTTYGKNEAKSILTTMTTMVTMTTTVTKEVTMTSMPTMTAINSTTTMMLEHENSQNAPVVQNATSDSNGSISWCQQLHFRPDNESLPITALASFPGSGNTWMRYLIMQATGIYAGSDCGDQELSDSGFAGETVENSSVIVVKTHRFGRECRNKFNRVILLVRSPAPAILAEFNRQMKGSEVGHHTYHASSDKFTANNGETWKKFVRGNILYWRVLHLNWLIGFHGPKYIVLYEDLLTNLEPTLRGVLNFLEVEVSDDVMKCVLERNEGAFHRKPTELPFDPFTEEMKEWIKKAETEVYGRINRFISEKQNKS